MAAINYPYGAILRRKRHANVTLLPWSPKGEFVPRVSLDAKITRQSNFN